MDPDPAPLTLPPATLHFPLSPHPDSDEHRKKYNQRTAKELTSLSPSGSAYASSSSPNEQRSQGGPSRSPNAAPTHPRNSFGLSRTSQSLRSRPSRRHSESLTTVPDEDWEADASRNQLRRQTPHWYDGITKWWKAQISVTIDEGQHRDHLALERTFLAYLRTSLAFAMTGVVIAQLFRLQHALHPNPALGFFVLGIPLAATFIGAAVVILLIGAFRFWRQQNAIIRGYVYAGGWEITSIMILVIVVSGMLFFYMCAS
ncbi:uncharacterized protein BDZ99DRAFT_469350 [Mytilinidion resinicola]|uniref:DUF202 domain-containing protein n=1 Tax=Mytilinidion resinicola TaxID=574789 RepID=A0A6A6Y200_9PEZI|nr:uncharacterized protein BDZ99DRAFT_469350 [Mytilinidion resinicola]KAF2801837.1 hypothetical protein BDZ99DRAFT_469350 [Mytilinidion resinicola]